MVAGNGAYSASTVLVDPCSRTHLMGIHRIENAVVVLLLVRGFDSAWEHCRILSPERSRAIENGFIR